MKTVFMGTPEFAVPILETLMKNSEVVLVVTQPDKYVGRKKVLTFSPIKEKALEHHIPIFQPIKIREDYEEIKKYQPDLIVTCAYGQIVPQGVLDIPRLGCINVHASLLPKYRGGAPIQRAIMNGEEETGITIMYMDAGMDTGDMIEAVRVPITSEDNSQTLSDKLSVAGAELLARVLPQIFDGTSKREKQKEEEVTYARIIKREDEHLEFTKKAVEVYNQVRALAPMPLANFLLNGEEVKVVEGYVGDATKKEAGTICDIKKDAIGIACSDHIYYVTKLKPFGKKEMSARDYLNGIHIDTIQNKKVE